MAVDDVTTPDPLGELSAASPDLPAWLAPWMVDEVEGATVNEVLGLLLELAIDPALFSFEALAERGVVHPGELARRHRGRLVAREAGAVWTLAHADGRAALRVVRVDEETLLLGLAGTLAGTG